VQGMGVCSPILWLGTFQKGEKKVGSGSNSAAKSWPTQLDGVEKQNKGPGNNIGEKTISICPAAGPPGTVP